LYVGGDYSSVCRLPRNFMIFEGLALTTTPMTAAKFGLMVITVERYFKIVHAVAHRKYYRNWMTKVGVALPWIGGASLMLIPSVAVIRIVNGKCIRMGAWPNKAAEFVSLFTSLLTLFYTVLFLHRVRKKTAPLNMSE